MAMLSFAKAVAAGGSRQVAQDAQGGRADETSEAAQNLAEGGGEETGPQAGGGGRGEASARAQNPVDGGGEGAEQRAGTRTRGTFQGGVLDMDEEAGGDWESAVGGGWEDAPVEKLAGETESHEGEEVRGAGLRSDESNEPGSNDEPKSNDVWLEPSESDSEYELESDDEHADDDMDGDVGVYEYDEGF